MSLHLNCYAKSLKIDIAPYSLLSIPYIMTPTPYLAKNQPRVLNAWASYDWANSVYNLVITTTIFPIFFNQASRAAFGGDMVSFFGFSIENTVLYSYSLSAAYLFITLLSPLLSGIADYGGKKRFFMQVFTYIGAVSCIVLFFFDGKNIELAIIASALASIGYAGGMVFYNAFLPEIATEDRFDSVSARGFALGYIGSVILQIVNILMIEKPQWFGITDEAMGARYSFLTVGVWWLLFAQIAFYYLRETKTTLEPTAQIVRKGIKELAEVWHSIKTMPTLFRFLLSFFFYNMGVQTVMFMASLFGEKELQLPTSELIGIILVIQLVAALGAYLFSMISAKKGNIFSLALMIVMWIVICLAAYFVRKSTYDFHILAIFVGLIMGGIQSLSRSTFSKLLPEDTPNTASFFSFFNIAERFSTSLGMLSYGLIEQVTGNMRNSAIGLMVFFAIGLVLLLRIGKMNRI
jgi:MFS transporter, UMF1 family